MKQWLVKMEWLVGGMAVLLGLVLQILLLRQGVLVPGALMLVVTGLLGCGIAWRDQKGMLFLKLGETLLTVLRRTLLFLNVMLSLLVAFTLLGALS